MIKQNALRAICESYISLLDFEGRLHNDFECLMCENIIEENMSLVRGFLPVHTTCVYGNSFAIEKMKELFEKRR